MIAAEFIATDPASIGIDPARLEALNAYVRGQVDGELPSAQVAIGRHGKLAGVATFGAALTLADSKLECNPIHIGLEQLLALEPTLVDAGGNGCGCEGVAVACKALSSQVEPPGALPPTGKETQPRL